MRHAHFIVDAALSAASAAAITLVAIAAKAAPVATAAVEDIRDIRGPMAIAPWWRWPLVAAVALLVVTALAFGVRRWRARTRHALSPLDRAWLALSKAEEHAREGRSREWADLVAETTRAALAAKLGAQILPQTTPELAVAIQEPASGGTVLGNDDTAAMIELLASCDLARFAKARLDASALVAATDSARGLVERLYAPVARKPAAEVLPARPRALPPALSAPASTLASVPSRPPAQQVTS